MKAYNNHKLSGVTHYEIDATFINLRFKDNKKFINIM